MIIQGPARGAKGAAAISWPKAAVAGVLILIVANAVGLAAGDRFRIEAFGGLMLMNPGDLNLLGRAEEQYNYILFQERLIGWTSGYFTNDFPKITNAVPVGLRLRFGLSRRLDASIEMEAIRKTEAVGIAGEFSYSEGYTLTESKAYDPYRVGIGIVAVTGGIQYRLAAGRSTEICCASRSTRR